MSNEKRSAFQGNTFHLGSYSNLRANLVLYFLGPIITVICLLLGYIVVPYGPGSDIWNFNLGVLYILIFICLAIYGMLLATWSIGLKYGYSYSITLTGVKTSTYTHPCLYMHLLGFKVYLAILLHELNIGGISFTLLSFILSYIYINVININYTNSYLSIGQFRIMVFKLGMMIIVPIFIFLGIGCLCFPEALLGLIGILIPFDYVTMGFSQKDYSYVWTRMLEHMEIKGQKLYAKSLFPSSVQQYNMFEIINFVSPSSRSYVHSVISSAFNTVYPNLPDSSRGLDLLQSKILDNNKLTPLGKFFESHHSLSKL